MSDHTEDLMLLEGGAPAGISHSEYNLIVEWKKVRKQTAFAYRLQRILMPDSTSLAYPIFPSRRVSLLHQWRENCAVSVS